MSSKDYYSVLGLDRNASNDDIKKKFRQLSKSYHPDLQHGKTEAEKKEAEKKFKEIAEAYDTLSDPQKKERYDRYGTSDGMGGQDIDLGEFFRRHSSMFGDMFGGGFGFDFGGGFGFGKRNSRPDPNSPKDGDDVKGTIVISFDESLYGTVKEFDMEINDTCDECHGTGSKDGKYDDCPMCGGTGMMSQQRGNMIMSSTCPKCGGRGHVVNEPCLHCSNGRKGINHHIHINIPRGVTTGNMLRVQGEGQRGVNGGKNGDMYLVVQCQKSDIFERDQSGNLYETVYISPIVATLGGDVDVVSPYGMVSMRIPAGTVTGKNFRLTGKGIKMNGKTTDLIINVIVDTIVDIDDECKRLMTNLSKKLKEKNFINSKNQNSKFKNFLDRNMENIKK